MHFLRNLLLAATCGAACSLAAFPAGLKIDADGTARFGGAAAEARLFTRGWKHQMFQHQLQPFAGYPVPSDKVFETQGQWAVPGGETALFFQEFVREIASGKAEFSFLVKSESQPVACELLCWSLDLPAALFDGRPVTINNRERKLDVIPMIWNATEFSFFNHGVRYSLTGKFHLSIQDNRKYSVPSYSVRIYFTPGSGKITEAKLKLNLQITPIEFLALPLGGNEPLKTLGDGKAGRREFGTVPFDMAPVGRTLVSGETWETILPPKHGAWLYLLHHASNNGVSPEIIVDGKTMRLEAGRDFDAALPMKRLPNAVAATADNRTMRGLWLSRFELPREARKLTFANRGKNGAWVLGGATVSDANVAPASMEHLTLVAAGTEWAPMERVTAPADGSWLDFSGMTEAPAGKNGWLTVDAAGHFVDGTGKRVRLLGSNVCFSALYADDDTIRRMADEMVKLGYNAVRIHHYDDALAGKSDPAKLDAEKMARLDFFFAEMKRRGLYVTLDLYCSRKARPGELPEIENKKVFFLKPLLAAERAARDDWKAFARALLTHRNPHTMLRWGDDPALFAVSLSNENLTYQHRNGTEKARYACLFEAAMKEQGVDLKSLTEEARSARYFRFLADLQNDLIDDLAGYLKKDLGYRGLVTELNMQNNRILAESRDRLDFVDNHNYWDHPNFMPGKGWGLPMLHNQMSAIAAGAWPIRTVAASRIYGKPFTLTEINFVFPNRYRAESGPLLGAYAALQDWDALFRFAWSHKDAGVRHELPIERFDIVEDSLSLHAERVTALLFRRGDVSAAKRRYVERFGAKDFDRMPDVAAAAFPREAEDLALVSQIGLMRENRPAPANVQPVAAAPRTEISGQVFSDNGEIALRAATGEMRVVTPRTESLAGPSAEMAGEVLRVKGGAHPFRVVTASAMDGKKLAESRRILVLHQTDVTNEGIRYSSEKCLAVEHFGKPSPLIRRDRVWIGLKIPAGNWQVSAVGMDGRAKSAVAVKQADGRLWFEADTAAHGGTMAYGVERR